LSRRCADRLHVTAVDATLAQVKKHIFDGPVPADDKLYKLAQELHEMLAPQKIHGEIKACKAGLPLLDTLSELVTDGRQLATQPPAESAWLLGESDRRG
jgi:hypothetical protein